MTLIDDHPREVAYECLRLGFRLRDLGVTFGWSDLDAILRCAPRDSAFALRVDPDNAPWGLIEQLLHSMEHSLRMLQWMKTEDAALGRDRTRPEPLPAPWVRDEKKSHFGSDPVPLPELEAFLGW